MIRSSPVVAVIVFASVRYDLKKVLRGIKSLVPKAPLFGCTTACEICNGSLQASVVITVLASLYLKVSCGLGKEVSGNWKSAFDDATNAPGIQPLFQDAQYWQDLTLEGKSAFALLFSPGNTIHSPSRSYEILEALKLKSLGRLPVFGGSAADDWRMETNYMLWEEEAFPDSMLLAVFETRLQFGIAMGHGFVPTLHQTTVTRVEGHEVLELDGAPAADSFARMVGSQRETLQGKHLTLATGHALGASDSLGQFSINVVSFITAEGGINLTQPVTVNTVLTLLKTDSAMTHLAGKDALRKAIMRGGITDPALSLVAYCALRPRILGSSSQEEIPAMSKMLEGSPLVGFHSFGEQGVADDGTIRHNSSAISVLVLGRDLSPKASVALENEKLHKKLLRTNRELLAEITERKRMEGVLKEVQAGLESCVENRTAELSSVNERLLQEIIHRRNTEEKLRLSDFRFKALSDATFEGIAITYHGFYVDVNKRLAQILGFERSEMLGMEVAATLPPEEHSNLLARFLSAGASRTEHEMLAKDGSRRCVEAYSRSLAQNGRDLRITAISDITDRKKMEKAIQGSEELFRTLCNSAPTGIYRADPDGNIIYINPYWEKISGLSAEESLGRGWMSVVHPEDREIKAKNWLDAVAARHSCAQEYRVLTPTGGSALIRTQASPIMDQAGNCTGYVGIIEDITEIRQTMRDMTRAIDALRESEDTLKMLMDLMPVGIGWCDRNGVVEYVNSSFVGLFGYALSDIPTLDTWSFSAYPDPVYRREVATLWKEVIDHSEGGTTPTEPLEAKVTCRDGSVRQVIINIQLARNRILVSFTDVTERDANQDRLLNSQRLESLGVLAGGIAHDFNNILTGIMGNISLARMFQDSPEKVDQMLDRAEQASRRAAELVRQLLTFARGGAPVKSPLAVRHLVHESVSLALHGTNVKAVLEIPGSLHDIEADAGQLSQVFNNIIVNAVQAMPGGGTMTVRAGKATLAEKNSFALPAGEYITLDFEDEGPGIPEQDQKRIFDPYFTTKPKGSGIGLSSAHSIVKKHGGHIKVQSTLGAGTKIILYLPSLGFAVSEQPSGKEAAVAGTHQGGTILVMDDELMVRDIARQMLSRLGYQVTTCNSGEEAVDLYRAAKDAGNPFVAAIMDLTIPGGMGGKEAARQILAIDPSACLIVSSGYSNDPVVADYSSYGFSASLAKPYLYDELEQMLLSLPRPRKD